MAATTTIPDVTVNSRSRSIPSTMFTDNKAILFLLVMPTIPFGGCM